MKNLARFYENTADYDSNSSFKKRRRRGEEDPMLNNRNRRNNISYNKRK